MKIQVTKKHIRKGICNNSRCCPIALALKDAGFPVNRVSRGAIFSESKYFYVNQFNEDEVTNFIDNFDYGVKVKPFEFEIKLKRNSYESLDW